MNIEKEIIEAFNLEKAELLSNEHIVQNTSPLFDNPNISQESLIPQYMLWVVRHGDNDGNIICDNTLSDIAFLGRTKKPAVAPFKFQCSQQQTEVVSKFIQWCKINLSLPDSTTINRVQKYW